MAAIGDGPREDHAGHGARQGDEAHHLGLSTLGSIPGAARPRCQGRAASWRLAEAQAGLDLAAVGGQVVVQPRHHE